METRRNKHSPTVSVILTVLNAKRFLSLAVNSILTQSFKDFELVIVNDGSTDGSENILKKYASSDERIILINNPETLGHPRSRNIGVENSRADVLAIMDADDVSLSHRFEGQLKILSQQPDLVLLGSDVRLIDPFGRPIQKRVSMPQSHEEIDHQLLTGSWPIVHPSIMIRRKAMELVQGYRAQFANGSDHDLFLRLAEIGRLANQPEVLLHYRLHLANMTFKVPGKLDQMLEDAAVRRGSARTQAQTGPCKIGNDFVFDSAHGTRKLKWALRYLVSSDSTARKAAIPVFQEDILRRARQFKHTLLHGAIRRER